MVNRMKGIQVGNCSLGDRSIQGGMHEKVTVMGDLIAKDANFHDLNILGDANISNCTIDSLRVAGDMSMEKGRIDLGTIVGTLRVTDVDCGNLQVLGTLKSSNSTCGILCYGKNIHIRSFSYMDKYSPLLKGNIHGETLESYFPFTLNGQQHFNNIINCGELYSKFDIDCAKFFSFSLLDANVIKANMIYLYPCAYVTVRELHASLVIIDPSLNPKLIQGVAMNSHLRDILSMDPIRTVYVDCIVADEVILDYVDCKVVRAKRVTVGPHANIGRIEYEEHCEIHPHAKVKEKQVYKKVD